MGSGYFAYFDRLPNGDLQEIPGTRVNGNIFSVVKNKRLMQGGDQLDLEVIPNPAQDEALLRFSIPWGQAAELEITDLEGKTLFEVPVAAGQIGLQERQLDLRGLPAGVYLVRLNSKQHNLVQKLLIQ